MPRRTLRNARALASAAAVTLLAGCGGSDSPSGGNGAAPTQAQSAALAEANRLRTESQLPGFAFRQALNVAAVKHAGYQAIEFAGAINLTHFETVDYLPGSAADTTNPLFVAVAFGDRIRAANGGANLFPSFVYYEGITTVYPPPQAVRSLWNTVYHRLPFCRRETTQFGFGDAANAAALYPDKGVPAVHGYSTCELAGPGITTTTSHWPNHGNTRADAAFDTDTESPDPIKAGNAHQSHPLPDDDDVGTPIHVIAPFSGDWTSVTVTLRVQGAIPTLPVYVIAGFRKLVPADPHNHVANPFPALPAGVDTFDSYLDEGELFILPRAPLVGGETYEYAVTAVAGADSVLVGDPAPIVFTTRP